MEEKQDSSRAVKERLNFKKVQLITRVTSYKKIREKENRTTNIGFEFCCQHLEVSPSAPCCVSPSITEGDKWVQKERNGNSRTPAVDYAQRTLSPRALGGAAVGISPGLQQVGQGSRVSSAAQLTPQTAAPCAASLYTRAAIFLRCASCMAFVDTIPGAEGLTRPFRTRNAGVKGLVGGFCCRTLGASETRKHQGEKG
ncbi:unnamed protein product [Rangifer tarandus platyrhynchus]|uniref:Uncharacterized protein n=2 Tax=Rangifer tarandus platyrhynchus TaxID=3082113 RepID=A0ACB0ESU2_RANTA|nr:unnamed protein product [Rangifer tarandus platyrhynchus]CAI9703800.1 unnamed protein product [Rangifer tarandus platyrhynchus]